MGVGITNTVVLEAEKLAMKPAISDALVIFWDSISTTAADAAAAGTSAQITNKQYADEFAKILTDTMFDRIITYVSTNALVTGSIVPPVPPSVVTAGGPLLLGTVL